MRFFNIVTCALILLVPNFLIGCGTAADTGGDPAGLIIPDGIDPKNPRLERTTYAPDFAGVKLIRVDIPRGRVAISQSADGSSSLKVLETILPDGLSIEQMARQLTESFVTAERSFVDPTRLDIKVTLSPDIASNDISFDIRLITPVSVNVEIFAENAPVEIVSLIGNVEIQTGNGEIILDRITGHVVAGTTNQFIDARDIRGNLRVGTSNAEIVLQLVPEDGWTIAANTLNAPIRLTIGSAAKAALELTAVGGSISADLAGFVTTDVATGNGFLRAMLNGGGGRIEATTTNAPIVFVGM